MYATIMIAVIGGIYLLKRKMKSFTARIDFNNHFSDSAYVTNRY